MDKISNNQVIELVKKYLGKVNTHYKIDKALLFGSRARDDWLYTSDVDLILVSDDFFDVPFLERMRKLSVLWDHMLELQVIGYTKEEFERKKKQIGIVSQAVKEGKELAVT